MPAQFDFATAGRIIFGAGALQQVKDILPGLGQKALLVTGSGGANPERLEDMLRATGLHWTKVQVTGEPDVDFLRDALDAARVAGADVVVAFGGGSVLDTGKALAALLTNPGDPLEYLEVVGRNQPLRQPGLPVVAIPTTAGTGSEVTRNAVLAVLEQKVKVSLRSPWMLPRVAVVDPELTYSLPPEITASTGMDALTQVLEPFVSARANVLTDLFCRDGLLRAGRSLRAAFDDGYDPAAREDMALASLFGGLALANAGLGAVHGFASPLCGMFPAPHGAVCAALLAAATRANIHALEQRQPTALSLERYTEAARILTGHPAAARRDLPAFLTDLTTALRIPPLRTWGVQSADIPAVVEKAAVASSMKANPIRLEFEEMAEILAACI